MTVVAFLKHPPLHEPSHAQKQAGNYPKRKVDWRGMEISIENEAGSLRRGTNRDGGTWEQRMSAPYGYLRGTEGVDGDHVDCFLGSNMDAPMVHVVHARKVNRWDEYDEDKCMIGFNSPEEAKQAFLDNYTDPRFFGEMTSMPVEEFQAKARATKAQAAMIKAEQMSLFSALVQVPGSVKADGTVVKPYVRVQKVAAHLDPAAPPAAPPPYELKVDKPVQDLIADGALFVVNHSGGKDSQAMMIELLKVVPPKQILVVHATLGDAEWPGALEVARDQAAAAEVPFLVAQAGKSFWDMVEHRYKTRPDAPSFPSAKYRQCTSDLKRGPIERDVRRYMKEHGISKVVSCTGIRAQESAARAKLTPFAKHAGQSIAGREWFNWAPIFDMKTPQVFATIAGAAQKPHWAYAAGNERLSCVFCIMGSKKDLQNGAKHNPALAERVMALEDKTGYTMHMSRESLRDILKQKIAEGAAKTAAPSCGWDVDEKPLAKSLFFIAHDGAHGNVLSLSALLKAQQLSLFDEVVQVPGSVKADGTVVKPYTRVQKKAHKPPAKPQSVKEQIDAHAWKPKELTEDEHFERAKAAREKFESSAAAAKKYDKENPGWVEKQHAAQHPPIPDHPYLTGKPRPAQPLELKQGPRIEPKPAKSETKPAEVAPEAPKVATLGQFGAQGESKAARRAINASVVKLLAEGKTEYSPDDKALLAQYSGNGGCGDSLNEFYTDPAVASAIWEAIGRLGYTHGTALEPSCGTGVFLHTAPKDVKAMGVELDPVSAKVAEILHGDRHEIRTSSMERFATSDERQFDVVVGNAPFGVRGGTVKDDKPDVSRADTYFLDTALDKTAAGGIVAMIVHHGVLDSARDRAMRQRLLTKGEFLGAIRMPNTAFEHSHTDVTSDILFFKKRPQDVANALGTLTQDQLQKVGVWDEDYLSGGYFDGRGRENILGTVEPGWRAKAGMGDDITVSGSMQGVPEHIASWAPDDIERGTPGMGEVLEAIGDDPKARARALGAAIRKPYELTKLGSVKTVDGIQYVLDGDPPRWHRMDEVMERPAVTDGSDLATRVERLMNGQDSDREALADDIKAYVEKHGNPGKNHDLQAAARQDKMLYRLIGAVHTDGTLSDLFKPPAEVKLSTFEVAAETLALENQGGTFTPQEIAERTGKDLETVEDLLHASSAYAITPAGEWTPMDQYLTGELWPKLDEMKSSLERADLDPSVRQKYEMQAKRLEETIDPKSLEDVDLAVNHAFIPLSVVAAYFNERKNASENEWVRKQDDMVIRFGEGVYNVENGDYHKRSLLERYLNRSGVKKDEWDAIIKMNADFKNWMLSSQYRDQIETLYNRKFRGYVAPQFSNAPIDIPGMNTEGLKQFQYGGTRWALAHGKGIIAADVGLGKTVRALMIAKLMKLQGKSKRNMIVVPKSVLANWAKEAEKWFPGSRVLIIGETVNKNGTSKADTAEQRNHKLHEYMQNDYDFVFISQPAFNTLDVDPETKKKYIDDDFWVQRGNKMGNAGDKRLNGIREAYDQHVASRDFQNRTKALYFNDLGVDLLMADEAHCFPAGTMIDGRAIETYKAGDTVRAYDHVENRVVTGRVANLQTRTPVDLYRVAIHDGPSIVCTGKHPFFTQRGYVFAKDLVPGDIAYKNLSMLDVQNRYRQSGIQDCNRSRWKESQFAETEANRSAQREGLIACRVDHVEVYEQTSDGTFGGMCPGGVVFNIEVEQYHNYFVDDILVHNSYKNLFSVHKRFGDAPKFLGGGGLSDRSLDMQMKMRSVRDAQGGKGVFSITATPTKNSPLEIYSMLMHVAPEVFQKVGIQNSEEFLDRFCEFATGPCLQTDGTIEDSPYVSGFKNMDELRSLMRQHIDRQTAADVGLVLPKRDDRMHLVDMNPMQKAVYNELRAQLEESAAKKDAKGDAHVFSIMDKMGKAALDLELLGDDYQGARSPKYDELAKEIKSTVKDGGQIVFCEAVESHEKIKAALVAGGIPANEIGIFNADAAKTGAARQKIQDQFNEGKLKVVIGNKTMEEGVNLQKGTADIHHLDIAWEPATMQQRNGRGLRQGNTKESIRIHSYLSKGSFDGYRYQSVMAKKSWQDILWSGGDKIENLELPTATRDDVMVMMAVDPEAAKAQMDANQDRAKALYVAGKTADASSDFMRFQTMKHSLRTIKNQKSDAANRLRIRIAAAKEKLQENKYFKAKSALDAPGLVLLHPDTGTILQHGAGIERDGKKWVVTSVDPVEKTVDMRAYGSIGKGRGMNVSMKVDEMGDTVKPFDYREADETAEVSKQYAADSESIADMASLRSIPHGVIAANYKPIQDRLKAGLAEYKWSIPYGARVPYIDAGEFKTAPGHEATTIAKRPDVDLVLPTPEHRERAIAEYIKAEQGRELRSDYVTTGRRRGSYRPAETRLAAKYPENGYSADSSNPWAGAGAAVFGDEFKAEARTAFEKHQHEVISHAPTFAEAVRAAAPTVRVEHDGTPHWSKTSIATLFARAKSDGILDERLADAVPKKNQYGAMVDEIHRDAWKVTHKHRTQKTDVRDLPVADALIHMATSELHNGLAAAMIVSAYPSNQAASRLVDLPMSNPEVVAAIAHLSEKNPGIAKMKATDFVPSHQLHQLIGHGHDGATFGDLADLIRSRVGIDTEAA